MGRTVDDMALLMAAQVGSTSGDPLSRGRLPEEFLNLERVDLGSLRVAYSADQGFTPVENTYRYVFDERMTPSKASSAPPTKRIRHRAGSNGPSTSTGLILSNHEAPV